MSQRPSGLQPYCVKGLCRGQGRAPKRHEVVWCFMTENVFISSAKKTVFSHSSNANINVKSHHMEPKREWLIEKNIYRYLLFIMRIAGWATNTIYPFGSLGQLTALFMPCINYWVPDMLALIPFKSLQPRRSPSTYLCNWERLSNILFICNLACLLDAIMCFAWKWHYRLFFFY